MCEVLVSTSNSIDDYFIEGNRTERSKTHAELISSMAYETGELGFENDVRVSLSLNLPKIQENLRLVFEDESSDDLLYDGTALNNQQLRDKEYYLRLEYFNFIRNKFNMRLGGGVKIRQGTLVPYMTTRMQYDILDKSKQKSELFNCFRIYSDGELENTFEFNTFYAIQDDWHFINRNLYYYTNRNPFQVLAHDTTMVHRLNSKKQLRYGLGISSNLNKFKSFSVEYYTLHSTWYHLFYNDWVYYEIIPSILQRRINDFQTSYRILVNFGLYFNTR
ncbi:MAG TPA: hypothetical protein ENK82_03900 [Campylobacterales bacterium]|nr:hypothetical protein [Campylobacterales bacterium]